MGAPAKCPLYRGKSLPKIYINKDKKGICGPFLLKFMNLFV